MTTSPLEVELDELSDRPSRITIVRATRTMWVAEDGRRFRRTPTMCNMGPGMSTTLRNAGCEVGARYAHKAAQLPHESLKKLAAHFPKETDR